MSPSFSALILQFFSIFPVLCWSRSCAPVWPCCAARNANVALSVRRWISAELCPGTDLFSPVSDFYRCSVFGPCAQAVRHPSFSITDSLSCSSAHFAKARCHRFPSARVASAPEAFQPVRWSCDRNARFNFSPVRPRGSCVPSLSGAMPVAARFWFC
jgi:hypothetical protein